MNTRSVLTSVAAAAAILAPLLLATAADAKGRGGGGGRMALTDTGAGGPLGRPKPIVRDHRNGYPEWGGRCKRKGNYTPHPGFCR